MKRQHTLPALDHRPQWRVHGCSQASSDVGKSGGAGGSLSSLCAWVGVLVSVLFLPVGLGMMLSRRRPCASPVFLPKVKWAAILLLSNCFMSGWRILFGEYLPTPSCLPRVPFFRLVSCRVEVQLVSRSGPASSTGLPDVQLGARHCSWQHSDDSISSTPATVSEVLRQNGPSGCASVL